jgi:hypothetical protein
MLYVRHPALLFRRKALCDRNFRKTISSSPDMNNA